MVCFRYIIVNTLHKSDNKDDDDDVAAPAAAADDDDNNNNNNNNRHGALEIYARLYLYLITSPALNVYNFVCN